MSVAETVTSSLTDSMVPMATSAMTPPPLPPELGMRGMIAEEQARAASAQAWIRIAPWIAGALGALAGLAVGFANASQGARPPPRPTT